MGKNVRNGVVAGFALWAVLTAACSSVGNGPAGPASGWGGSIVPAVDETGGGRPLAIDWDEGWGTEAIYRLDPSTLRLRRALRLDSRSFQGWDLSADGSLLLGSSRGRVRVIDVRGGRAVDELEVDVRGFRDAAWVGDDVAILVASGGTETKLVRVRPSTGEVLDVERIAGTLVTSADAGSAVVLLVQDLVDTEEMPSAPRPATLAVMDSSGAFATRRLDAVGAGHFHGPTADYSSRAVPALAVRDARATVVGTDGVVVTVDLVDLDVTVETESSSLVDSLAAWFVPTAQAKVVDATELKAEWISADELLVSGFRTTSARPSRHGSEWETEPAGAVVLDADDWSSVVVDEEAYAARMAGDRLLTWTPFMYGDERHEGIGLRAYDAGGDLAWQAFDGQFASVVGYHRGVALVDHGWHRVLLSSVDVTTGDVLATREMSVSVVEP